MDEPAHIGAGMQWLDKGLYTYEAKHPPLARIAIALGPYFKGIRSFSVKELGNEGNEILHAKDDYINTLASARSGNLLFLALACLSIFLWTRRWFSPPAAYWAVLLFLNLPPILAHSGVAALDMACAATVTLALYAFVLCLENPSWRNFALLGSAVVIAFLSKLSSPVFLGFCFFLGLMSFFTGGRSPAFRPMPWRSLCSGLGVGLLAGFLVLWASYRFSFGPVKFGISLPFPEFFLGILEARKHNAMGHGAFLFGEYRIDGWWYFFPVVILFKTPIAFLILATTGVLVTLRQLIRSSWQSHLTLIFPLAILLICMTSNINIGLRHALAIYPLLAIFGGYAIARLFEYSSRSHRLVALVPVLLMAWTIAETWRSRDNHLAYFNQFAGDHPEHIVGDSDLDWGQDLYRLSARLKQLGVDRISLAYFGPARLDKAGLPSVAPLSPNFPPDSGYVAISVRYLTYEFAKDGSFGWLVDRTPIEVVGKSIYLYKLDR